jgi:hypothetical protein
MPSLGAAQHHLDPFRQEALRKGFTDEIVGPHFQAEQFVDLLLLRGEKDHRQVGFLPQPPQSLHAVHARHLDIENGEIGRRSLSLMMTAILAGCHWRRREAPSPISSSRPVVGT